MASTHVAGPPPSVSAAFPGASGLFDGYEDEVAPLVLLPPWTFPRNPSTDEWDRTQIATAAANVGLGIEARSIVTVAPWHAMWPDGAPKGYTGVLESLGHAQVDVVLHWKCGPGDSLWSPSTVLALDVYAGWKSWLNDFSDSLFRDLVCDYFRSAMPSAVQARDYLDAEVRQGRVHPTIYSARFPLTVWLWKPTRKLCGHTFIRVSDTSFFDHHVGQFAGVPCGFVRPMRLHLARVGLLPMWTVYSSVTRLFGAEARRGQAGGGDVVAERMRPGQTVAKQSRPSVHSDMGDDSDGDVGVDGEAGEDWKSLFGDTSKFLVGLRHVPLFDDTGAVVVRGAFL